jgi:hypothetical protein
MTLEIMESVSLVKAYLKKNLAAFCDLEMILANFPILHVAQFKGTVA